MDRGKIKLIVGFLVVILVVAFGIMLVRFRQGGNSEQQLSAPNTIPRVVSQEPLAKIHSPNETNAPTELSGHQPIGEIADLPPDPRAKMIEQLIDKKLPLQPNPDRVKQNLIRNKTLEELVEGLGDTWCSSVSTTLGGVTAAWRDVDSLAAYLPEDPRVIRIIEQGRRDPEKVGPIVAADLAKRIKRLPEVFLRLCEEVSNNPNHTAGFTVSDKGEVAGSNSLRQWEEDRYAISAAMWIFVNIRYSKGIDSIWEFGSLMEHPDRHFTSPKLWPNVKMDMFKTLCPQMAVYSVDVLLKSSQDPAYDRERAEFSAIIKNINLSKGTKRVKGSSALYPTGHIAEITGVDMSSEPWIDVDVPDGYSLKKRLSSSDIESLMKILSQTAKKRAEKNP